MTERIRSKNQSVPTIFSALNPFPESLESVWDGIETVAGDERCGRGLISVLGEGGGAESVPDGRADRGIFRGATPDRGHLDSSTACQGSAVPGIGCGLRGRDPLCSGDARRCLDGDGLSQGATGNGQCACEVAPVEVSDDLLTTSGSW